MAYKNFYSNDFFDLMTEDQFVYIQMKQAGFEMSRFNKETLQEFPRIKVTKFAALSNALDKKPLNPVVIGIMGELVEVSVSKDNLEAYGLIIANDQEFEALDKTLLIKLVKNTLREGAINYGLVDIENIELSNKEKFLLAKGVAPIPGDDAIVSLYEIEDVKPTIEEKGDVDHYELNIINQILEGDWLGDRIEPTIGTPGISVYGLRIEAPNGQQIPLVYDPKTVSKIYDEETNKSTLRAKKDGAVTYNGESVCVQNSIEVDGSIGFSTGNIDFNGYVDISGTVEDNFSVVADYNIQIQGDIGIGAIELIESRKGDVYIRGGISGREKAIIRAKNNVYTKFANNCSIYCEGTVNIGFYAMNCNIEAKEVIFESRDSQLIGGETNAKIQVRVGSVGSKSSTKTYINIEGFEREKLSEEFESIKMAIEACKGKVDKYKDVYDSLKTKESTKEIENKLDEAYTKLDNYKEQLKKLQETLKKYMSYLQAKGEGELQINKTFYPNVFINIKDKNVSIDEPQGMCSVYYNQGEIVIE